MMRAISLFFSRWIVHCVLLAIPPLAWGGESLPTPPAVAPAQAPLAVTADGKSEPPNLPSSNGPNRSGVQSSPATKPVLQAAQRPPYPAAEPLRDPTVMSARFRDALRIHASSGNTKPAAAVQGERDRFNFQVLGLVSSTHKGKWQALLKVGDLAQPILVEEGFTFSASTQGPNVDVVHINEKGVEIFIPSINRTIVLQ